MERILGELQPSKSKDDYDKAHRVFMDFCKGETPSEELYMTFFDGLRNEKKYRSSTLWSFYSKLNSYHQIATGRKLQQDYPRLTMQLKNYNRGEIPKQSAVFTQEQIWEFLSNPFTDSTFPKTYWILRKCLAAVAFCGGLRCAELKSLQFESFSKTEEGYIVKYRYVPAKQREEVKQAQFLIPINTIHQDALPVMSRATFTKQWFLLATPLGTFSRRASKREDTHEPPWVSTTCMLSPKQLQEL